MESPLSFDSTENFRKKLLLKNLKPYRVEGSYTPTQPTTNGEIFLKDQSVLDTTPLEVTSKIIEPTLIGQNKYTPNSGSFGNIVNINLNNNTQTNLGLYGYPKSQKSFLELFGKTKEKELLVQNQYGPEGQQSKNTVNPNVNFQSKANEGNYGYPDSINSDLEKRGNELEKFLRVLNKYGPEKGAGQYGDTVVFKLRTPKTITGEYRDQKDAEGSELETKGQSQEIFQYTKNKYGPQSKGGKSYGSTVDINKDEQTQTNFGEYLPTESSGDGSQLERLGEQKLTILLNNTYQPFNPVEATPNNNIQQKPNKGEYTYRSYVNKTTEESQTFYYSSNRYNSGEGILTTPDEENYINETINSPYLLSDTTFAFIPSDYLPISILNTDNIENINGSEGKLSQDSALAQLGAKQLQKEFKARVAFELLQQTLGKSTLTNSSISPDSGGVSVKPNLNPFDALGVLSNKLPIIQRNFQITSPLNDAQPGTLTFAARLSGLYSPYSIIPGQYFDYPNRNLLSQVTENPVGAVNNLLNNLINKITTPLIDTSSELFLANTSPAVRNLLFDQLFYNFYRPNYLLNSLSNPNLLAPQGNYYIGSNRNFIRDAVSPKTDLPKWKNGKSNIGPVFSYSEISKEYEGQKITDLPFGIYAKPFYDSVGIQGGFTWIANNNIYDPGKFVGPGNLQINNAGTDTVFEKASFGPEYNKTKSSGLELTEGSLLDVTQKLVQAANNSTRRTEHVGNAINQVSKVFKDGLIEMTKGSKVIRYTTPNSVNKSPTIKGYEYCRLFTKDRPYYTFNELQKKDGLMRVGGKNTYSVLDNTYNLNIAPMGGSNSISSTNIIDGKVKKYMLSIENLAWRTSNRPGYRVDDLPACEIGPNGGRIMWFPPYDLSFNDTSQAQWEPQRFLGRPEPVYTYKSTERSGSLSFKMVVDHPSILNIIVNKELEKESNSEITKIVDSFFAGCLKYDPIDLLKKYRQFSLSDIFETTEALRTITDLKLVTPELPKEVVKATTTTESADDIQDNQNQTNETDELIKEIKEKSDKGGSFEEIILFFDQAVPKEVQSVGAGLKSDAEYETLYSTFINNEQAYKNKVTNIINYPDGYYIKFQEDKKDYNNTTLKKYKTFEEVKASNNSVTQENLATDYIIFRKNELDVLYVDIKQQKNNFDDFLKKIAKALDSGASVKFNIVASANANGDFDYNEKLSKRRYDAVLQTILKTPTANGTLKDYYEKNLKITPLFEGKDSILKTSKYSNISCKKPFPNSNLEGFSSIQAMLCRRTTITGVEIQPVNKPTDVKATTTTTPDDLKEKYDGAGPDLNAAENNNTQNPTPQYQSVNREVKVNSSQANLKGLTKKLLRKLLSECDYFKMVEEQQPMIYDGIKSKIKNFQPVFHSTTPEGLNSRLTFLHQCVRPGDTIPTAKSAGNQGQTVLEYNDVFNSAFGTPPVVVIRVGDFYHTKAIIDSVSLKYDDAKFDINPEGIGLQPMIADVTLQLKFIGGHGLAKPIEQIQNALTFNYYANTEIYDERAEETEPIDSLITDEVLQGIKDEFGILDIKENQGSGAGNTIGTVKSNFLDVTTSAVTGSIQYKAKMNELVKTTKDYFDSIYNNFEKINKEALIGGIILYNNNKKYTEGLFNWLSGSSTNKINIFGKPVATALTIRQIVEQAKKDVDDELSPILGGLDQKNFPNEEKRKIKRKLKEMIESRFGYLIGVTSSAQGNIINSELKLIQITDELNFICDKVDGYINKRGGVVVYDLSGNTGNVDPSTPGYGTINTFDEFINDFLKVGEDLNTFNQKLDEYKIVPSGDPYTYNTDYLFEMYLKPDLETSKGYQTVQKEINVFFIVFGKEILDDYLKFVNEIVSVLPDDGADTFRDPWKQFLLSNLGFNYEPNTNTITKRNSGLYQDFERSKTESTKLFEKFKNEFLNGFLPNNEYKPFNADKSRIMDYAKQNPTFAANEQNLRDVWSSIDIPGSYFNLKKTLN